MKVILCPLSNTVRLTAVWWFVVLVLLSLTARGDPESDFVYQRIGAEATITIYYGPGGAVVIPDQLGGLPVKAIGPCAFGRLTNLTSVTIPNGVTTIWYSAFSECTGLTNLVLPDSLTSIEQMAFAGCSGLKSVTIPNSVTADTHNTFAGCTGLTNVVFPNNLRVVGGFSGCTGLKSVTIPNSVTSIWPYAFIGCTGLTNVVFPKNLTVIGGFSGCTGLKSLTIPNSVTTLWGFSGCTGLTNVTIPNNVTYIGWQAFSGCTGLKSVTIPNSVTNIGDRAFSDCSGLTTITIPDSVTYLAGELFSGCTALTTIEVGALNPAYRSVDGVLFNKAQTALLACPGAKAGTYAVPDGVTNIGWNAFFGCTGLTHITIPDSVTGLYPFLGCPSLRTIEVGALNPAFSSLDGVLFNKAQTTLIAYPEGKAGTYVIPNSVTNIGWNAFWGCAGLTSITIPNSVTTVEAAAFHGCTGLTNVVIPNSLTRLDQGMFSGCTGLKSITIPNSVTNFGQAAFKGCTSLTNVTIPNSVTEIGETTFSGCTSLTSVTIPGSVTAIGDAVFRGCTGLTSVTIPNRVAFIGTSAFEGCTGLTSVTIPNSVTYLDSYAFDGCTRLTSVTIPRSVTTFERAAFARCTALTSLYFEGDAPNLDSTFLTGGGCPGIFSGSPFVTVFYRSGTTGWGSTYAGRPTALWVERPSYADWAVSTGLIAQFPNASGEGDDADGDGFTNGDEWFAGSDPTQSASRLELELTPRPADLTASDQTPVPAGQRAVYVRSVLGRYYGVKSATELSGAWALQAVRVASTTQTRFVLPASGPQTFYRVLALP